MYIPDLFGAYVKGRELAIEKNWQDLKNFEAIEDARNKNDLNAMDIWERRQQMPGKMNMFYNNVDASEMATDVLKAQQRGKIANANVGSDFAVDRASVFYEYQPDIRNALGNTVNARLRQMATATDFLNGKTDHLAPIARDLGKITAEIGENQTRANHTTSGNLVNSAGQRIAESNATYGNNMLGHHLRSLQTQGSIEAQPYLNDNALADARNYIPDQEARREAIRNADTPSPAYVGDLITSAIEGNNGAIYQLKRLGYTDDEIRAMMAGLGQVVAGAVGQAPAGAGYYNPWHFNSVMSSAGDRFNYPVAPGLGTYRPIMPQQGTQVGTQAGVPARPLVDPDAPNSYGVRPSVFHSVGHY